MADAGNLFSLLPRDLILSIIISLPLVDAIALSTVLTVWDNMWIHCRIIELEEKMFTQVARRREILRAQPTPHAIRIKRIRRRRFIEFVNTTLPLLVSPVLTKFSIRVCYEPIYYNDLANWILYATSREVQELILDFSSGDPLETVLSSFDQLFTLPEFFNNLGRSIWKMSLNTCRLGPFSFSSFKSLTSLLLNQVELSMDEVSNLLTNCPILQVLSLLDCYNLIKLEFSSPELMLERLVVKNCKPLTVGIELYAPRLRYFEYSGGMVSFIVKRLINIEEVVLDFKICKYFHYETMEYLDLLWGFSRAKNLKLCSYVYKVLSSDVHLFHEPPLHMVNLEHLTLKTCLGTHELTGICYLLGSLPNLKTLNIINRFFSSVNDYLTSLFAPVADDEGYAIPRLPFLHLETILLQGFTYTKFEMDLLKFLLINARNLRILVIIPRRDIMMCSLARSSTWRARTYEGLSNVQMASRHAQIIYRTAEDTINYALYLSSFEFLQPSI